MGSISKIEMKGNFLLRFEAWWTTIWRTAPLVAMLVLFNVTGIRGVDFGNHWDEAQWHLDPALQMVQSGVFLPHAYIYPTFDKWLVLLPTLPPALLTLLDVGGNWLPIQTAMLDVMRPAGFLLTVRTVFIITSSLGIVWVYGAALALRRSRWEALIAASGLGLSWEYAYHARWAVNDCILVQFSALTLFMLALHHRARRPAWLYAAAVAIGLATGTKYTGVGLLAPLLFLSVLSLPRQQLFAQACRAVSLCAVAFVVYLVTTPGTILEPFIFLKDTHWLSSTYALHPQGQFSATSGWDHARIVLNYLALAYFSPYRPVALILFIASLLGAGAWLWRDRAFAVVLVGFPLLFLTSFCVQYRLVVVRNYLFVMPFSSVLMARGVSELSAISRARWLRSAVAAAMLAACAAEALWLVGAAESIRHLDPPQYARQALDYVKTHRSTQFRISDQVRALLQAQSLSLPENVVTGSASHVVFLGTAEGPGGWNWKVNDPNLTEAVFGPREVNFNWYSSWESGRDRVVIMTLDRARATGVPLAK